MEEQQAGFSIGGQCQDAIQYGSVWLRWQPPHQWIADLIGSTHLLSLRKIESDDAMNVMKSFPI